MNKVVYANLEDRCGLVALLLIVLVGAAAAQRAPEAKRIWSVGPLVKPQTAGTFSVGAGGTTFGGMHVDTQTGSTFVATRSVVFAGNRIVVAASLGMQTVEGRPTPVHVCQLLSLDAQTGVVKDRRDFPECLTLPIFATNDGRVIVSGRQLWRLTPDLKDDGIFDEHAGHKLGGVENISPDGSTLGNSTRPGFELVDARTLTATPLTRDPSVDTSVSTK